MINSVKISNFGPITNLEWKNLGNINLVIGGNGQGKTFLLKALYSAMRTLEEYKRGDDKHTTAAEILADKLYWTFQPDKIGDLVTKGADESLSFMFSLDKKEFSYSFGKDTTKQISSIENHVDPRSENSIYLPSKEVLSLYKLILKSRDEDKAFGFDDTYYDLAKVLNLPLRGGKNYEQFANVRKQLKELVDGSVEFDETANVWQYKKGNQRYPIGVTAEGIKKIALLDTLLRNRYLTPKSVVFIDEPESALHPRAISLFLDMIAELSSQMQFFLATHSYFVIKKLFLIAQEKKISIPVISAEIEILDSTKTVKWQCADIKDGMPDNPIIDESIRLYEEEVDRAFQ